MFEPHLFDENAAEEQAHCGKGATRTERIGVREFVKDRLYGCRPRAVCQDCEALAMPFAEVIIEDMAQDLEDEGRLGDAEDCRELLNRLVRGDGAGSRAGLGTAHMWVFFAFQAVSPLSVNR